MRTVVLPLEGSPSSLAAMRPAYATAQRCGAQVVLVTGGVDVADRASAEAVRVRLEGVAERFDEVAETTVVISGEEPVEAIAALASAHDDAVVAMATHGRRGLSGTVLGSVATEVLRSSGGPVLLVGPSCRSFALPRERAELVVCVEGSWDGEVLAGVAAHWCAWLSMTGRVTTVTVPEESVSERGWPRHGWIRSGSPSSTTAPTSPPRCSTAPIRPGPSPSSPPAPRPLRWSWRATAAVVWPGRSWEAWPPRSCTTARARCSSCP